MSHIDKLNEAQREAVLQTEGPVLVLAGAGAGKTRVIAHRILEIVRRGTAPEHILAITFTNKAAKEMRERVTTLLSESPEITLPAFTPERMPFVSTFHSLGLRLIKENYRLLGFARFPAIYDRSDSMKIVKQAMKDLDIGDELEARTILSVASRNKGDGVTPDEFISRAKMPRDRAIGEVWARYERALAQDGALDFDDLLSRALYLLREHADIRTHYQQRWTYVHIDEYQDTNAIQSEMASLLVGPARNICCVGDMDQCIYGWRGADIKNIMSFEKAYPGAKIVLLEENYRSTKTIIAAANHLISKNQFRMEKNLFTSNEDGEKISFFKAFNESDEARFIARVVRDAVKAGAQPREFAVLYRANFQSRALEEAFLQGDVAYQVLGTRFFDRAEVKDTLSYLRAALSGASADVARAAQSPRRGIGKTALLAMVGNKEGELRGAGQAAVAGFRALLARIAGEFENLPPSQLVSFVIRESGLEREWKEDKAEGQERLENVRELIALARRYDTMSKPEGLHALLEGASLTSDQDEMEEDQNAVRLMTVHASKGLEFPTVFVTGMEEGLFPYAREGDKDKEKEEERRLMYVAVTRARRKLYLTMAAMRTVFGSQTFAQPSQFLADIPGSLVKEEESERLGRTIYLG